MFGYFAGRRGAGCSLLGLGCNLRGAGHGLLVAECELLSLILEFQTCQLGLCFDNSLTQKCFLTLCCVIRPASPNHAPQPVNYTLQKGEKVESGIFA